MRVSTPDFDLTFTREPEDMALVTGDWDSLDVFRDSVALAGASEGSQEPSGIEVVQEPTLLANGAYRASRATVALFLGFEALNYL